MTSGGHYAIHIELQSGKMLSKEASYVTNDVDFRDVITVTDTDIRITAATAR